MNPWIGWALALAVAAGFCSLGVWQLGRAQQKQAMLDAARKTLAERRPQPLSLAADAARAQDYDWAAGEGEFVAAPAVLLDNQTRDGAAGVRVYRLFKPTGAAPLLVELGWLPLPGDRTLPRPDLPKGKRRVQGLLSPPPARGLAYTATTAPAESPKADALVTAIDMPYLGRWFRVGDLPPRVLRLDPELKDIGYARDLDVLPNTMPPQRHLAYAVQWFGLATAVLATAALLTFRRRRAGRAKMAA
ncbi:MAG: SURF1 family protein [Pseudoxanthomonas sp.]